MRTPQLLTLILLLILDLLSKKVIRGSGLRVKPISRNRRFFNLEWKSKPTGRIPSAGDGGPERPGRSPKVHKAVPGHSSPGPREGGDLALEEVQGTEASPGETREALRILARWLARAALEKGRSPQIPETTGDTGSEIGLFRLTVGAPRGNMQLPENRGVMRKAVGYLRRSTDRQEQSIPDQRRAIELYASENGYEVLDWYLDDAVSGTSSEGRKAFRKLIQDAQGQNGKGFRYVLTYDVKRFGRVDNDEAGYYRHLLRKSGVEVVYISESFAGDDTDDLLRPVKQWQARQEAKDRQ